MGYPDGPPGSSGPPAPPAPPAPDTFQLPAHSPSQTESHPQVTPPMPQGPVPPPPPPTIPGPPGAPPGYAPTHPQILVLPLPDAPGFFWGRTLQGEVFVKGLGEARTRSVESLTVTARLTDRLPGRPDVEPVQLPPITLYHTNPAEETNNTAAASAASAASAQSQSTSSVDHPFPASHRFAIPLPTALPDGSVLPASLDLGAAGSLRWSIGVRLALLSGEILTEMVNVEGAPPELDCGLETHDDSVTDTEAILERDGVRVRLLLASSRPRLGEPLRIGVEVRPKKPERVTLAGLVAQADPDESLRPLRRVRVELVRLVDTAPPDTPESTSARHTYTSIVHASGKSLRYPGSHQPPLRVLFTLSTAPLHPGPLATGGEISSHTPYHNVQFVVRATLGFGSIGDTAGPGTTDPARDWCVEEPVTIRPPLWHEPRTVVIERGVVPMPGHADLGAVDTEESAREAYRRKGLDTVGPSGTTRVQAEESDLPPPFTDDADAAGPSGTSNATPAPGNALPSFTESEAQMRSGQAPVLSHDVPSQLLQTVSFEDDFASNEAQPRRSSLTGELATWVEYDGYERFSAPPPPAAASFGVASSMDPPREGDDDGDVVGSIVARLGLPSGSVPNPAELMEQLGLGQGTRVVDLQDDLPPGIDEPSLPALPGFGTSHTASQNAFAQLNQLAQQQMHQQTLHPHPHPHPPHPHARSQHAHNHNPSHPHPHAPPFAPAPARHEHPPSFDASEAAEAVGGVARSRVGSVTGPALEPDGDAPPGYFGGGPPAYS